MESRSYKSYIDELILANFKYDTFAPENSNKLFDIFKKVFCCDTPYWKKATIDGNQFYIEFKKYGENRKSVLLKFSFTSRSSSLTLTDEELKPLNKSSEISFSDVWKDHGILTARLKEYIEEGLKRAAETN